MHFLEHLKKVGLKSKIKRRLSRETIRAAGRYKTIQYITQVKHGFSALLLQKTKVTLPQTAVYNLFGSKIRLLSRAHPLYLSACNSC